MKLCTVKKMLCVLVFLVILGNLKMVKLLRALIVRLDAAERPRGDLHWFLSP